MLGIGGICHVEALVVHRLHVRPFLAAVREFHLDRQRLPIPAQSQRHHASRRSFVDHPMQLRLALDGRSIHRQNNVVLPDAGISRGSVLIDHRDFDALLFLQLQRAQPVGSDIRDVNTKISARVPNLRSESHKAASSQSSISVRHATG